MSSDKIFQLIKQKYVGSAEDATGLFEVVLAAAAEIGMDQALAHLEQCVTEKRLAWLNRNWDELERTGYPVFDAYRLFYEVYLGVSVPEDGQIVTRTERTMVTRWWNHCPTLEACQKLGLDTREVCRKAYHRPVQEFLVRIHPGLRFNRNYQSLRPHISYCEEIITLEDWRI